MKKYYGNDLKEYAFNLFKKILLVQLIMAIAIFLVFVFLQEVHIIENGKDQTFNFKLLCVTESSIFLCAVYGLNIFLHIPNQYKTMRWIVFLATIYLIIVCISSTIGLITKY